MGLSPDRLVNVGGVEDSCEVVHDSKVGEISGRRLRPSETKQMGLIQTIKAIAHHQFSKFPVEKLILPLWYEIDGLLMSQ